MSSVRMCDKCGGVFSELADGWQAFTAQTIKKNPDTGRRESVTQQLDACPSCAIAAPDKDAPPMLLNPEGSQDPKFFERAALEQKVTDLEEELAKRPPVAEPSPAEPAA